LASAGCTADLDDPDAGCVKTTSDGPANTKPHESEPSAGCAGSADDAGQAAPSKPTTQRAFEAALRGLGFTRREAAHIGRHGFAAHESAGTDAGDIEQLRDALQRSIAALKD